MIRHVIKIALLASLLMSTCVVVDGRPEGRAAPGHTATSTFIDSGPEMSEYPHDGLNISVTTDRSEYELGEPVRLTVNLKNVGHAVVRIPVGTSVHTGRLRVLVAEGNGAYKLSWGAWVPQVLRGPPIALNPGQAYTTSATLLWNYERSYPPGTNPIYVEAHERQNITTGCVFWVPGTYRICLAYTVPGRDERVLSDVISIKMREPRHGRAALWEVMREDPDGVAHYLQSGAPSPSVDSRRMASIIDRIRRAIAPYPTDRRLDWVRQRVGG